MSCYLFSLRSLAYIERQCRERELGVSVFQTIANECGKVCRAVIVGLSLCAVIAPAVAQEKTVAPGETWRITPAEAEISLQRLVLGDGARIEFSDEVADWRLNARHVSVGQNVVIDGRGRAGEPGRAGLSYEEPAATCEDGAAGGAGSAGGPGGKGVDLSLNLGIARIGSLRVLTDGGPGGAGGPGGKGQHGGDISKCRAGAGGRGGMGGPGGPGGAAGDLTLVYRPLGSLETTAVLRAMELSAAGGAGGSGGVGGPGGGAVEGRYMKGSIAGNKKWLAGGDVGGEGSPGAAGEAGPSKNPIIQQAGQGKGLRVPPVDDKVERSSDIGQLEKRIEELERRLQALELKAQQ